MDLDYDVDMDALAMRDTLPQSQSDNGADSDNDAREDLEVQWKSSQTSNRALDSLMLEAAQNTARHASGHRSDWSWSVELPSLGGASAASTSRVKSLPTLSFEQPQQPSFASTSGTAAMVRRRSRGSVSNAQTPSLSVGRSVISATPDPAQFLKFAKGVSKQADENAEMRTRAASAVWGDPTRVGSAAGGRASSSRQGVKQSSKNVRHASGSGTKGKERERDRDRVRVPVSRGSSTASTVSVSPSVASSISPSLVSSPASNYSFLSTDADTSMTSPEPDEWDHARDRGLGSGTKTWMGVGTTVTTQELMPPPPVPPKQKQNPLPALDVCITAGRTTKSPPDLQARPDGIAPAPVKMEQSPSPAREAPEPRMHPILQQQKPTSQHANGHTSANAAPPPAARTYTPTYTYAHPQSQPQQRRPPVLGMRRTNTAPPLNGAASTAGPSSSSQTATRKFRPPLLNPEAAVASVVAGAGAGGVTARVEVKSEKTDRRVPVNIPKPGPPPAVRMNPRVAEPLKPVKTEPAAPVMSTPQRKTTQPASASSPWSDNSFDEHNTSFDLDELERVMQEYD
ncbi:hypothetical protein B0H12DRAFT_1072705 [Mycena haematopus]|nr:hypothetical protein B0H12DRAFT_1072705 [Mycena haematopus]